MLTSQTIFHSSNKYISSFEKPHGSDSSLNPGILLLFLHAWRQLFEHTLTVNYTKRTPPLYVVYDNETVKTRQSICTCSTKQTWQWLTHIFSLLFVNTYLNYRQHRMQWKPEDWRRLCVATTLETDQKIIYRQGILNLLKSNITQA